MQARHIAILLSILFGLSAIAANEISTTVNLRAAKGSSVIERAPGTIAATWDGRRIYGPITYTITNAWVQVTLGGITNAGWCYCRNVDTTNTVSGSWDNGTTSTLLWLPGEASLWRFSPTCTNLWIKGNSTGGTNVYFEVTILEK